MAIEHDIRIRLETLNRIGAALSSDRDIGSLMERIVEAARQFTLADGVTLYRKFGDRLVFDLLRNHSLGLHKGGLAGEPVDLPEILLHHPDGSPNHSLVVTYAALTGATVNVEDATTEPGFDFSGTRAFDQRTGYRSQSFLTVPMKDHADEVIGVLQLINAEGADGGVRAFTEADQQLVESLASQAAIALNNHRLLQQMGALFESLIKLINSAIDEKSPYTGGHCERVPQLAGMVIDRMVQERAGPYQAFSMTEDERYEFHLGAWLHDCGKVTSPEHIIDKATKLETIYNRIHEIRMRFEVLQRDAELNFWKAVAAGGDRAALQAALQAQCAQLQSDFAFVARCNVGGEFMADEDLARLQALCGDDRVGSPVVPDTHLPGQAAVVPFVEPPPAPGRRAPVGGSLRPSWSWRSSPPASRPTTFVTTHRRRPPVLRPVWATLRRSAVNSCPPAAQRPPAMLLSHPTPSRRRSTGPPAATA